MELIIDTASVEDIKRLTEILNIDGVTTNPSIICKTKKQPLEVIKEIVSLLTDDQKLFVQVVSTKYEDIVKEARFISTLKKKNMYVKIPVSTDGYKAMKTIHKEGIKILATAVYSAEEGMFAAKAKVEYIAPYCNRMDNYGDGVKTIIDLNEMLIKYNLADKTKICAASFKNTSQVHELLKAGIFALTIPVDVIDTMINHPGTKIAIEQFSKDWETTYNLKKFN